jgi:hypothetical protein
VPEHFQVVVTLLMGQLGDAHVVPWYREEKGVREVEVTVGDSELVVVPEAEREAEAIKTLRDQHREVVLPESLVAKPGQVLQLAAEQAHHAANLVGRPLHERSRG